MSVYVLPSVFSALLIICGLMAWKMPLPYSAREIGNWPHYGRWPHYDGKIAHSSKELWDKAQVIYGKIQFLFGIIHIFMEFPEVMLLRHILQNWQKEDATLPAMLCFAVPGIAMVIAGNIVTTLYLKRNM